MKRIAVFLTFCAVAFSVFGQETLQMQPSLDGKMEGSLIKVKVRRDVLTVQLRVKVGDHRASLQFNFKDVYFKDPTDDKKYFPSVDPEGRLICGPKYDEEKGGQFRESLESDQQRIIWVKFPAPPQSSGSVDIFFPGFPLFKGVAIAR